MRRDSLVRRYRKQYKKAVDELEKAGLDPDQYLDYLPKPGKTRALKYSEIQQYLGHVESVLRKDALDIVRYKGYKVPKFYKELFKESLKEYNRSPVLRQVGLEKFKPPTKEIADFFEYAPKIIQRSTQAYERYREEVYKSNYLKALKDSFSSIPEGKQLLSKLKNVSAKEMLRIYHVRGNEDLGIYNVYPGDEESAQIQAEYLIERWDEVLANG